MTYPTLDLVELADRLQICRWYRFLPSPVTDQQIAIMNHLVSRFKELGGFTPAISKHLGW